MSNIINLNIGMKGLFRALSYNPRTGKQTPLTEWSPNSMLLSGMNLMGQRLGIEHNNWAGASSKNQVGTVSIPAPATTDTQLLGYIDGTATVVEHTSGAQATAPFYGWDRTTYQYNPDDNPDIGEENLQEAGVGWSTENSPAALITRALFTDGIGGNPTFTPLDDEFLQVQYELRYYPPLVDTIGTVTLDGVLYNTISRASQVAQWGARIGKAMGVWTGAQTFWVAYDGEIGTIEQAPSGLDEANDNASQFNLQYSNNSFVRDMQINVGPTGFNLASGIRSIWIATNAGFFQTQFTEDQTADGTIPKDINFTMALTWRLGWGEKIL